MSRHKKSDGETTWPDAGVESKKGDDLHDNITSCAVEEESGHGEKHVHFSEDVEIITPKNEQKVIAEGDSDGSITVGDLQVSSKWLHMDTVETEKLEWMKDCPAPSAVDSKVLFNPYCSLYISYGTSKENLSKYQDISFLVITFVILIT